MSGQAKIKNWFVATLFALFIVGTVATVALPQRTSATSSVADCSAHFLTFPTWFRGMVKLSNSGECVIMSPNDFNTATAPDNNGTSNFIWRIALNIVEIALQMVGYIAVGFVLYGGFQFLTSNGDPNLAAKSRTTILNAVIGLVISIASVGIINLFIGIFS